MNPARSNTRKDVGEIMVVIMGPASWAAFFSAPFNARAGKKVSMNATPSAMNPDFFSTRNCPDQTNDQFFDLIIAPYVTIIQYLI